MHIILHASTLSVQRHNFKAYKNLPAPIS